MHCQKSVLLNIVIRETRTIKYPHTHFVTIKIWHGTVDRFFYKTHLATLVTCEAYIASFKTSERMRQSNESPS